MKHLFLFLCVFFGLSSFAQVVSPPPLYELSGKEPSVPSTPPYSQVDKQASDGYFSPVVVNSIGSNVNVREANTLPFENFSGIAAEAKKLQVRLVGKRRADIPDGKARIILKVGETWNDNDGYSIWLDKDCTIEHAVMDELMPVMQAFGECEIIIPKGATTTSGFAMANTTTVEDIDAGTYDFLVTNPDPDDGAVYVVYVMSDSHEHNMTFVSGYEYTFDVGVYSDPSGKHDMSILTANSDVDLHIKSSSEPGSGKLTDAETVSFTLNNSGDADCKGFVASYSIDGGPFVEETSDAVIKGNMQEVYKYTFKTPADLSAEGQHTIVVKVQGVGEALVMEDNMVERIVENRSTSRDLPYECDFKDKDDPAEWNMIDADGDNVTWRVNQLSNSPEFYKADSYNAHDDYMIMAAPVSMEPGIYTIELKYGSSAGDPGDNFSLLYGQSNNPEEMTLIKKFEDYPAGTTNGAVEVEIKEKGDYYFGFYTDAQAEESYVCTDITWFKIYAGSNTGAPDLVIDKVILPMSSTNMTDFDIQVEVRNIGIAPIESFNLTATRMNEEFVSESYTVPVEVGGKAVVTMNMPKDYELLPGTYSITVDATYVMSKAGVAETNTSNNSGYSSFINFEEAELPFISDFTNSEGGRYWWYDANSWLYNSTVGGWQCQNADNPFVSRGIQLKAGKTYRITYNRRAGMNYLGILLGDDYKIIVGENGSDFTGWKEIANIVDDYSEEIFAEKYVDFTVDKDGLYQLGFQMTGWVNTTYPFYLRNAIVSEVVEKDVKINAPSHMPTRVPVSQGGEFEATVPVSNVGSTPVSGTIDVTVDGELIGQGTFTDVAVNDTVDVVVPVTLNGEEGTSMALDIFANVEGEAEGNLYNNNQKFNVMMTDIEMAYDQIPDNIYYGNQPNNPDVGAVGNGGELEMGIVFHFNYDTKIAGMSVGWAVEQEMEDVVLSVYKWNPVPDADGYFPLDDPLYTLNVVKEYGVGSSQTEYMFDKVLDLAAGDYIMSVKVPTNWPLAVDKKDPGMCYALFDYGNTRFAADNSGQGLGTLAIRALLSDETGSSIGSVDATGATLRLYPNPASETLYITSGNDEITGVSVYSASGTLMCTSEVNGGTFSCNVSSYTPGVYFARVATKAGTEVMKFVVK